MSSIPLYLKIKSPLKEEPALFETDGDSSIILNEKQYEFTKIYSGSHNTYKELLGTGEKYTSYIFMGPTGSGKTTTLRQVMFEKIKELESAATEATITAFEVSENRYVIDLLETPAKRKEYHSLFLESQLNKTRLDGNAHEVIETVFKKRKTKPTAFNSQSSRSCLVVTFIYNGKRVNYIDLMGNEKYDRSLSLSNAFANTNMSSITQLLANKRNASGRSSNIITNLIFSNSPYPGKINIILHVDPHGDITLLKSILNNIATLVKDFKLENTATNKLDNTFKIPHYAQPTISSMSPTRIVPTTSPLRKLSSTPSKFKMTPSTHRSSIAPKVSSSRSTQKFQTPTKSTFLSPTKTSLPFRSSHLTKNFYNIQISSLKQTIKTLEIAILNFKKEHKEIMQTISNEHSIISNHESLSYEPDQLSLKKELNDLIRIKNSNDSLLKQKNVLHDKIDDFKTEFYIFKQQHNNFTDTLNNLKKSICEFKSENISLISKCNDLTEEASLIKKNLEELEHEKSVLSSKYETLIEQNTLLKQSLNKLEEENKKNQNFINDNQNIIDELSNKNKLMISKLQNSDNLEREITELKERDIKLNKCIKDSNQIIAEQRNEINSKDSIIEENKKQLLNLNKSTNMSLGHQQIIEDLRKELVSVKSEVQQLTTENKLISDKHSKSIEELKTYKYKFKTLNNSWSQKFDKVIKSKDQGILKLQAELNEQNAKYGGSSNIYNRKFLGCDIFEDKPQFNTHSKGVAQVHPLQPSNISKLDNQTNKTVSNKNNNLKSVNNSSKVKKAHKKKKNHK